MRYLDLCSGAGGASYGLLLAGLEPAAHIEWDRQACAALAASPLGPDHVQCSDLRQRTGAELPEAELWWASPPCQPFSSAGQQRAHEDERNLFPCILRLVREAQAAGRGPRWLVAENVVGLTQHRARCPRRGGAGPCSGCYWEDVVLPGLERLFAVVEARVLNAADYGVPQIRRRVITVAGAAPVSWPLPTHSAEGGLYTQPWVSMAEALELDVPDDAPRAAAGAWWHRESDPRCPSRTIGTRGNASITVWGRTGGPSPTVTGRRRLTVRECAILQGFPPDWPFSGTQKERYRQVGNAVPPPLAEVIGRNLETAMTWSDPYASEEG